MIKRNRKLPTVDNVLGNFAGRPVRIFLIAVSMVLIIFPLYWLVISSLKIKPDYLASPPIMIPKILTLDSFRDVFGKDQLMLNFINTFFVAAVSTVISVILGSMQPIPWPEGPWESELRNILVYGSWYRRCIPQ